MIENYSLYYSYKAIGDVLIIDFDNQAFISSHHRVGEVEVIYDEERLIGYNIFNVSKIMKIKTSGMIFFPSPLFIDVINSILSNANLENLSPKSHSGYFIGEIVDFQEGENNHLYSISLGSKIVVAKLSDSLNLGDKVVVALQGSVLNTGKMAVEVESKDDLLSAHICTNRELNIQDDDRIFLVDEDENIGNDFFQIGD